MGGLKLLILGCLVTLGIFHYKKSDTSEPKFNGISLVASGFPLSESSIPPIVRISANHAALMPFGFMKSLNDTSIRHNTDKQWYGESVEGIAQYAKILRRHKIGIMLKPQIWVSHGAFSGDVSMRSEKEWQAFEKQYTSFILTYAKVAAEIKTELFCIGTELKAVVRERPEYWKVLIKDVRAIYKGKITYAANWDSYDYVKFWEDLDYIGIDAYFPISKSKTPTVKECRLGWKEHKAKLRNLAFSKNRKIIFTEYGYCSTDYTAKEPWNPPRGPVNLKAQSNALEALHLEFWKEDWFAGGYVWKWFHDYKNSGGVKQSRFTPENKPAEEILKKYYQ